MSDPTGSASDVTGMVTRNPGVAMGTSGSMREMDQYADADWEPHERHWREQYATRPYVQADLERGWTGARGTSQSTWAEIKDAARDDWDRARGRERAS